MAKKILITGISGFAGSHLAEYLLSKDDVSISGTYLSKASLKNVSHIADKLHLTQINLKESAAVIKLVASVKPDVIIHLAALTAVGNSFEIPVETIVNNVTAQINVLEAVRSIGNIESRIVIVTSADVYGKVSQNDLPIDEDTAFMPTNAYAVSKITQDYLGLQYALSYNLQIIRARPFNHIGPRQATGFAIADWAQKIAKIEKGQLPTILKVGNLSTKRDFTDVRDIVRAYDLLLEKGKVGDVYNIGSGISYKISDILDTLLSFATKKISVEADPALIRPEDSPERLCDNRKFVTLTGWHPEISIEQTLKETLDYWRDIV